MSADRNEVLQDLLVEKALWGLDAEQAHELERFRDEGCDLEALDLDMAAAALDLALAETPMDFEPMPKHLRTRVDATGVAHVAFCRSLRPVDLPEQDSEPSPGRSMWIPWLVAAAAVLVTIGLLVQDASRDPSAQQVWNRVARAEGTVKGTFQAPGKTAGGATGELVWHGGMQKGVMRFRGLPVNDRSKMQYQLWIFDRNQSTDTPVDGGVFDIDKATGDVLVPMDPKLPVGEATLFAVTAEKPGGVVVSDRKRLLLTAEPGK